MIKSELKQKAERSSSHHLLRLIMMQAIDEPNFPFFIEWENRDHRPDQTFTDHKVEPLVNLSDCIPSISLPPISSLSS